MYHHSENCPVYLAECGRWSSTANPTCTCFKKEVVDKSELSYIVENLKSWVRALEEYLSNN